MNVDRFTLQGSGSFTGFLFDEHSGPQPAGGNSFHWVNVSNVLVEGVRIAHFDGSMWIHFAQNITVRNVTLFNRNTPEETGNIEVGGMGSHGVPPPLCAWKDGKFNPADPCLVPGANWQYELNLLRPTSNFTMRDSTVNGGDDNVCIKNDTDGVLVENVHFTDGHGASIGSIPDCNGCHGYVSNVVFRNCTFPGQQVCTPVLQIILQTELTEIYHTYDSVAQNDELTVGGPGRSRYLRWQCPDEDQDMGQHDGGGVQHTVRRYHAGQRRRGSLDWSQLRDKCLSVQMGYRLRRTGAARRVPQLRPDSERSVSQLSQPASQSFPSLTQTELFL